MRKITTPLVTQAKREIDLYLRINNILFFLLARSPLPRLPGSSSGLKGLFLALLHSLPVWLHFAIRHRLHYIKLMTQEHAKGKKTNEGERRHLSQ